MSPIAWTAYARALGSLTEAIGRTPLVLLRRIPENLSPRPVSPPLATGAPSTGNRTASTATVTIDGISGEVQFSGTTPGFVGLNQVTFRIPASTRAASDIPVVLSIGGRQSNTVTIAVGP